VVSITLAFHFTQEPQRAREKKRTEKAPDLGAIRHRSARFLVRQGRDGFIHDAGAYHPEQPCDEDPDRLSTHRRHGVLGPRWVEEE
jgi:hypothetical protein